MYVLKEPKYDPEYCHGNYVSNITHHIHYDSAIELMVLQTMFNYDFFDYAGPSIAIGYEGMYSGACSLTFVINSEAGIVDQTSVNLFASNKGFESILAEVHEYYNLLGQLADSANTYIGDEQNKLLQARLNILNKEDFEIYQDLTEYMQIHELTTLSAALRSVVSFGVKLHKHGMRVSPMNKIFRLRQHE